jgi:dTMP kinase
MDKKRCKYICLEGCEGVGKTTQTQKLVDYLRAKGFKVLQTKEPGTSHLPLTMVLRAIMLDKQYDEQLTIPAREFISQAIRSIHIEKLILPALNEYDYIIQDRGILSGLAYGHVCGNDLADLGDLTRIVTTPAIGKLELSCYDSIIYLKGDTSAGLKKALQSKKEFAAGDAMEAKGNSFLQTVSSNMDELSNSFNTVRISVDGKNIEEVFSEILYVLNIGESIDGKSKKGE